MGLPRLASFVLTCALLQTTSAHAELIDLGNGMIYDTVQDLTWLSDMRYAWTSGYDDDAGMPYWNAVEWANNLVFGGYDDWRLPRSFLPPAGGSFPPLHVSPWSEVSAAMIQLGWRWVQDEFGAWDYRPGGLGPFVNFRHPLAGTQFWVEIAPGRGPSEVWNYIYDFDIADQGVDNPYVGAWAVRDGLARVPEPSTLALAALGLFALVVYRRCRAA